MTGIIEAAGLSRDEAADFVSVYAGYGTIGGAPSTRAACRLANAVSAELEASRPIAPGDVVKVTWMNDRLRVVAVDGDEMWLQDLAEGSRLTVRADCVERINP